MLLPKDEERGLREYIAKLPELLHRRTKKSE
jgi:hypothetical protein